MTRESHPFTEEEPPHKGWRVFTFNLFEREWGLINIDDGREPPHSQFSPKDNKRDEPWPHFNIMALPGSVSVQACVEIIREVYTAYTNGKVAGSKDAKREVRAALGL